MEQAFQYIGNLPPWISIPIILLTLLTTLWPKIYQIILDLSRNNRVYLNKKRNLEIKKLHYEIEILKKNNNVEDINFENNFNTEKEIEFEILKRDTETPSTTISISKRKKFAFGALGGFLPPIYSKLIFLIDTKVSYSNHIGDDLFVYSIISIISIIIFASIGGGLALFLPKASATPLSCAMLGLSVALIIIISASAGTNQSPALVEISLVKDKLDHIRTV